MEANYFTISLLLLIYLKYVDYPYICLEVFTLLHCTFSCNQFVFLSDKRSVKTWRIFLSCVSDSLVSISFFHATRLDSSFVWRITDDSLLFPLQSIIILFIFSFIFLPLHSLHYLMKVLWEDIDKGAVKIKRENLALLPGKKDYVWRGADWLIEFCIIGRCILQHWYCFLWPRHITFKQIENQF